VIIGRWGHFNVLPAEAALRRLWCVRCGVVVLNYFFPAMVAPWHGRMAIRVQDSVKNMAPRMGEIAKWLLRFSGDHHLTTPNTSICYAHFRVITEI
jgi:hypothetical protein